MAPVIVTDYARLARELAIDRRRRRSDRRAARRWKHRPLHHALSPRSDRRPRRSSRSAASARASARLRQLEERKQTILRSIESQNKLTDELRREIEQAESVKRLEDLYLPYRPKKQSLATRAARARPRPARRRRFSPATKPAKISTPGPPTSSTPTKASPTALGALRRRPHPGRGVQRTRRPAAASPQDLSQVGPTRQHQDRRQRKEESPVPRLPRFPRSGPSHSAPSRAGDQPRRAGQGAPREDRVRRSRPSSGRPSSCSCRPSIRTRISSPAASATPCRASCFPAWNARLAAT